MATLALPISELAPAVSQAQAETERVVFYSKSAVASFGTAWHILSKTISLRHKLSKLATKQNDFIDDLVGRDFSASTEEQLRELAESISGLVIRERDLLNRTNQLGSEIRVWWSASLISLAEQVEHLDSIAESLYLESDPKGTALLAMAVGQFTMKQAEHFAVK